MLDITIIILLFILATQLFTVALGIDAKQSGIKSVLFALILAFGQAFLFWLGHGLGSLFMHLMEGFKSVVIFAAFFLIGIRMLMESYQVWKGLRTYNLDSFRLSVFAGLAQGINAFLVGLIIVFFPFQKNWLVMVLFAFALLFAILGTFVKSSKNSITFAALMYVAGGVFMVFSSIYLGFFAL